MVENDFPRHRPWAGGQIMIEEHPVPQTGNFVLIGLRIVVRLMASVRLPICSRCSPWSLPIICLPPSIECHCSKYSLLLERSRWTAV